jgi:hypothetical protein
MKLETHDFLCYIFNSNTPLKGKGKMFANINKYKNGKIRFTFNDNIGSWVDLCQGEFIDGIFREESRFHLIYLKKAKWAYDFLTNPMSIKTFKEKLLSHNYSLSSDSDRETANKIHNTIIRKSIAETLYEEYNQFLVDVDLAIKINGIIVFCDHSAIDTRTHECVKWEAL